MLLCFEIIGIRLKKQVIEETNYYLRGVLGGEVIFL
jgi:hypothetical protein